MSSLPFAELAGSIGFACDPRFAAAQPGAYAQTAPGDPLARAYDEGRTAGLAEAQDEACRAAEADEQARAKIELALARLDGEQAEALRQKLCATVAALCEASLAPLALDPAALTKRAERAAAMLARADDDRVLRLHPADLALIGARLPQGLAVLEDPALERGALRLESSSGGVEDGPEHWRRAIAEALAAC